MSFLAFSAATNVPSPAIAPGSPRAAAPPRATGAKPKAFSPCNGSAEHNETARACCDAAAGEITSPANTAIAKANAVSKRVRLLIPLPSIEDGPRGVSA
jgi:hypothetical protein